MFSKVIWQMKQVICLSQRKHFRSKVHRCCFKSVCLTQKFIDLKLITINLEHRLLSHVTIIGPELLTSRKLHNAWFNLSKFWYMESQDTKSVWIFSISNFKYGICSMTKNHQYIILLAIQSTARTHELKHELFCMIFVCYVVFLLSMKETIFSCHVTD